MIRKILLSAFLFVSVVGIAQEGSKSPYSFFGIGELRAKGTNYDKTLGGLGVMMRDSIRINLQNPAGYAGLRLTNYALGLTYNSIELESDETTANTDNATVDYLTLAFPLTKKIGVGFGFFPFSSVGFELQNTDSLAGVTSRFQGTGGINRLFLGVGYQINNEFSVGFEGNFNFGNLKNTTTEQFRDVQFGTREENKSEIDGFSFKVGVHHEKKLFKDKDLIIQSGISYSPEVNLSSDNSRFLTTVIFGANGNGFNVDTLEVNVPNTDLVIPMEISAGTGIGKPLKWFAGVQYTYLQSSNFTNRFINVGNVSFENSNRLSIGGYYIPDYRRFSGFFKRAQYMAGIRYEETGIVVNGESIDDFGINFGLGLPVNAGGFYSNMTVGIEIGQKGTTSNGLIKENYVNFRLAFSFNDLWFQKRKYN